MSKPAAPKNEFGEIMVAVDQGWVDLAVGATYRWEGGPFLLIDDELLDELPTTDDYILIGPYKVEYVQNFVTMAGRHLFVRVRDPWHWFWWHLRRRLRLLKARTIQTLVVWRLAWIPYGMEPQWTNIFLLRRFLSVATSLGQTVANWARSLYFQLQVLGDSLQSTIRKVMNLTRYTAK